MDNLLNLVLEARNPERNHMRRYEVQIGQDLFGFWTATITHGRIGARGRSISFASATPDAVQAFVRDRLKRRESSPQRIGVPYKFVSLMTTPSLAADSWIPPSLTNATIERRAV